MTAISSINTIEYSPSRSLPNHGKQTSLARYSMLMRLMGKQQELYSGPEKKIIWRLLEAEGVKINSQPTSLEPTHQILSTSLMV